MNLFVGMATPLTMDAVCGVLSASSCVGFVWKPNEAQRGTEFEKDTTPERE
jgi:hypothetical protein